MTEWRAAPIVILAALVLGTGCADLRFARGPMLDVQPETLVAGETTLAEVLEALGPPDRMSALETGFAFLYERFEVTERQVGINLAPISKWIKVFAARGRGRLQVLLVDFDTDGIVRSRSLDDREEDLGGGGGLQLIVTVAPLVDVSDLTAHAPQHRWGAALLEPLPIALNWRHSPDSGAAGLEQRGTPVKAGQRTPEGRPTSPM